MEDAGSDDIADVERLEARFQALVGSDGVEAEAEQLAIVDEVLERFGETTDRRLAQAVGWALLTRIALLLNADRDTEAEAAAARLEALFARQEDDQDLTGFGTMLLDAGDWLMSGGLDEAALRLDEAVAERLSGAEARSRQIVAARARLGVASALGRLGRHAEALAAFEAFHGRGEVALEAVDASLTRIASRPEQAPAIGRLLVSRVAILSGLGRREEARATAELVAERFGGENAAVVEELLREL